MFSLDDRPALPETPAFRAEMEQFLTSAAHNEPRRSRPNRRALIAVTAASAAAVVALGAAVASNGPSGAPGRVEAGPVHVHLADFTVDTNPGGTVTVTLSDAQILDPNALRQALAQAGIPAMVTPGSFCFSPVPDRTALFQAVTFNQPGPGEASDVVITPSKLPAGSTLAIGYVQPLADEPGKPYFDLLSAGAPVTCSTNPPPISKLPVPAPPPGSKEPTPQAGSPVPAAR
jgi:hypothetical protein